MGNRVENLYVRVEYILFRNCWIVLPRNCIVFVSLKKYVIDSYRRYQQSAMYELK